MTTIDLDRIATFVRVVEAGSFTAAARKLRVPVSSVSRAIANLEWELGVRLLHRTTRRLSLTDGGQHFFQRMQTVISETEEATRAVTGLAGEPRGLVRITAPPEVGARAFPRIVATLLRRYPGLVIDLKLTNRVVDLVADGSTSLSAAACSRTRRWSPARSPAPSSACSHPPRIWSGAAARAGRRT